MPGLKALRITDGTSGSRGREGDQTPARMPCEARKARSRVGRTVQVRVRAAVRTNQAACRQKRQFLGTCSRPVKSIACGTQASTCFCGRLLQQAATPFAPSKEQRLPCASRRRAPCVAPACRNTWRRGRGETPGVPHAPLGPRKAKKAKEVRLAPGRAKNRGDEACLEIGWKTV